MHIVRSAVIGIGLLAHATIASAQGTGSQGFFQIHNNTEENIVVGFYTNDGNDWSENWLSGPLEPGDSASAEFNADSGNCAQTFQIGWLGDDDSEVLDDPIDIDICEASNVYLDDNEIYYD